MSHVEAIQSKVLFISAENGWGLNKDEKEMFKNRLDVLRSKVSRSTTALEQHHSHLLTSSTLPPPLPSPIL